MAPVTRVDHDALEQQLKDVIQTLTNIMVQVTNYDATAPTTTGTTPGGSGSGSGSGSSNTRPSRDVIAHELRTLSGHLQTIHGLGSTSSASMVLPQVPPELVQYVDNGRNPDIYTREFVELLRRSNQLMRGKQSAFAAFRDVLAAEMDKALPELRDDVATVVAATSPGPAGSRR
ncbi:mediator complex, subunit Med10 [Hypoxylon cercidicola]|nr:mediator complex, subunit Med10 [Hypoxylon cercidicola]